MRRFCLLAAALLALVAATAQECPPDEEEVSASPSPPSPVDGPPTPTPPLGSPPRFTRAGAPPHPIPAGSPVGYVVATVMAVDPDGGAVAYSTAPQSGGGGFGGINNSNNSNNGSAYFAVNSTTGQVSVASSLLPLFSLADGVGASTNSTSNTAVLSLLLSATDATGLSVNLSAPLLLTVVSRTYVADEGGCPAGFSRALAGGSRCVGRVAMPAAPAAAGPWGASAACLAAAAGGQISPRVEASAAGLASFADGEEADGVALACSPAAPSLTTGWAWTSLSFSRTTVSASNVTAGAVAVPVASLEFLPGLASNASLLAAPTGPVSPLAMHASAAETGSLSEILSGLSRTSDLAGTSGLTTWLDASSFAASAVGDPVCSWPNKGASGIAFVSAAGSVCPTVGGAMTGARVNATANPTPRFVRFSAASMQKLAAASAWTTGPAPFTWVWVARLTGIARRDSTVNTFECNDFKAGAAMLYPGTSSLASASSTAKGRFDYSSNDHPIDTLPHVFVFETGSGLGSAMHMDGELLWQSDRTVASAACASISISGVPGSALVREHLDQEFAEFLAFQRALGHAERGFLETHLAIKYGLYASADAAVAAALDEKLMPDPIGLPFSSAPAMTSAPPLLWFDSADLSASSVAAGAPVCSWANKGSDGTASSMTQGVVSHCPTFLPGNSTSAASVLFTPSAEQHLLVGGTAGITMTLVPSTFMYVFRFRGGPASGEGYFISESHPSRGFIFPPSFMSGAASASAWLWNLHFVSAQQTVNFGSGAAAPRHIITAIARGPASFELYLDGILVLFTTGNVVQELGAMSVGGRYGGSTFQGVNAELGELIAYDRPLSAGEREALEKGLAAKHGVVSGLFAPGAVAAAPETASLWLDASSMAEDGIASDTRVSTWRNKGTHAVAATSEAASNAPLYLGPRSATLAAGDGRGVPVVRFAKSLTSTIGWRFAATPNPTSAYPLTIMFVCRAVPLAVHNDYERLVSGVWVGPASNEINWLLAHYNDANIGIVNNFGYMGAYPPNDLVSGGKRFYVATVVIRSASWAEFYVNGVPAWTTVSATVPANGISLGGIDSSVGAVNQQFGNGDIGQFFVWSRTLGVAERRVAEARLAKAYNITDGRFAPPAPAGNFGRSALPVTSAYGFPGNFSVWLDAATFNSSISSRAVCSWPNKGALGGAASQTDSARCPTFVPSPWPGATAGAVRFSSAATTVLSYATAPAGVGYSLSYVFRYAGGTAGQLVTSAGGTWWGGLTGVDGNQYAGSMLAGTVSPSDAAPGAAFILTDTLPHVITIVSASTRGTKLYMDGRILWSTNVERQIPIPDLRIGGGGDTIAQFFNGDLAELAVVDEDLADGPRTALETYLARKHGVRTGLFGAPAVGRTSGGCTVVGAAGAKWTASGCAISPSQVTHACCEVPARPRTLAINHPPAFVGATATVPPPIIFAQVFSYLRRGAVVATVAAADVDPPTTLGGSAFRFLLAGPYASMFAVSPDGIITVASPSLAAVDVGEHNITVSVVDGVGEPALQNQTVTVTVSPNPSFPPTSAMLVGGAAGTGLVLRVPSTLSLNTVVAQVLFTSSASPLTMWAVSPSALGDATAFFTVGAGGAITSTGDLSFALSSGGPPNLTEARPETTLLSLYVTASSSEPSRRLVDFDAGLCAGEEQRDEYYLTGDVLLTAGLASPSACRELCCSTAGCMHYSHAVATYSPTDACEIDQPCCTLFSTYGGWDPMAGFTSGSMRPWVDAVTAPQLVQIMVEPPGVYTAGPAWAAAGSALSLGLPGRTCPPGYSGPTLADPTACIGAPRGGGGRDSITPAAASAPGACTRMADMLSGSAAAGYIPFDSQGMCGVGSVGGKGGDGSRRAWNGLRSSTLAVGNVAHQAPVGGGSSPSSSITTADPSLVEPGALLSARPGLAAPVVQDPSVSFAETDPSLLLWLDPANAVTRPGSADVESLPNTGRLGGSARPLSGATAGRLVNSTLGSASRTPVRAIAFNFTDGDMSLGLTPEQLNLGAIINGGVGVGGGSGTAFTLAYAARYTAGLGSTVDAVIRGSIAAASPWHAGMKGGYLRRYSMGGATATPSTDPAGTSWHVVYVSVPRVSTLPESTTFHFYLSVDGAEVCAPCTSSASAVALPEGLWLGGGGGSDCEIGEVFAFSRALTAVERQGLTGYLGKKYIAFDPSSPLFSDPSLSLWFDPSRITTSSADGATLTFTGSVVPNRGAGAAADQVVNGPRLANHTRPDGTRVQVVEVMKSRRDQIRYRTGVSTSGRPYTFVTAARYLSATNRGRVFQSVDESNNLWGWHSNGLGGYYDPSVGNINGFTADADVPAGTTGDWRTQAIVVRDTPGILVDLYVDGDPICTTCPIDGAGSGRLAAVGGIAIGGFVLFEESDAHVGDAFWFNRALSPLELAHVHEYLAQKYSASSAPIAKVCEGASESRTALTGGLLFTSSVVAPSDSNASAAAAALELADASAGALPLYSLLQDWRLQFWFDPSEASAFNTTPGTLLSSRNKGAGGGYATTTRIGFGPLLLPPPPSSVAPARAARMARFSSGDSAALAWTPASTLVPPYTIVFAFAYREGGVPAFVASDDMTGVSFGHDPTAMGTFGSAYSTSGGTFRAGASSATVPSLSVDARVHIMSVVVRAINFVGTLAPGADVYVDGVQRGPLFGRIGSASPLQLRRLVLGGHPTAATMGNSAPFYYSDVDVGDVLVYSRALRPHERRVLESYLAVKFGTTPWLSGSGPPGHPTVIAQTRCGYTTAQGGAGGGLAANYTSCDDLSVCCGSRLKPLPGAHLQPTPAAWAPAAGFPARPPRPLLLPSNSRFSLQSIDSNLIASHSNGVWSAVAPSGIAYLEDGQMAVQRASLNSSAGIGVPASLQPNHAYHIFTTFQAPYGFYREVTIRASDFRMFTEDAVLVTPLLANRVIFEMYTVNESGYADAVVVMTRWPGCDMCRLSRDPWNVIYAVPSSTSGVTTLWKIVRPLSTAALVPVVVPSDEPGSAAANASATAQAAASAHLGGVGSAVSAGTVVGTSAAFVPGYCADRNGAAGGALVLAPGASYNARLSGGASPTLPTGASQRSVALWLGIPLGVSACRARILSYGGTETSTTWAVDVHATRPAASGGKAGVSVFAGEDAARVPIVSIVDNTGVGANQGVPMNLVTYTTPRSNAHWYNMGDSRSYAFTFQTSRPVVVTEVRFYAAENDPVRNPTSMDLFTASGGTLLATSMTLDSVRSLSRITATAQGHAAAARTSFYIVLGKSTAWQLIGLRLELFGVPPTCVESATAPAGFSAGSLEWNHIAITFGLATSRVYVNGARSETPTLTPAPATAAGLPLVFGGPPTRTSDNSVATLPWALDDVRIFDWMMSDQEVESVYLAGAGPLSVPAPSVDPAPLAMRPPRLDAPTGIVEVGAVTAVGTVITTVRVSDPDMPGTVAADARVYIVGASRGAASFFAVNATSGQVSVQADLAGIFAATNQTAPLAFVNLTLRAVDGAGFVSVADALVQITVDLSRIVIVDGGCPPGYTMAWAGSSRCYARVIVRPESNFGISEAAAACAAHGARAAAGARDSGYAVSVSPGGLASFSSYEDVFGAASICGAAAPGVGAALTALSHAGSLVNDSTAMATILPSALEWGTGLASGETALGASSGSALLPPAKALSLTASLFASPATNSTRDDFAAYLFANLPASIQTLALQGSLHTWLDPTGEFGGGAYSAASGSVSPAFAPGTPVCVMRNKGSSGLRFANTGDVSTCPIVGGPMRGTAGSSLQTGSEKVPVSNTLVFRSESLSKLWSPGWTGGSGAYTFIWVARIPHAASALRDSTMSMTFKCTGMDLGTYLSTIPMAAVLTFAAPATGELFPSAAADFPPDTSPHVFSLTVTHSGRTFMRVDGVEQWRSAKAGGSLCAGDAQGLQIGGAFGGTNVALHQSVELAEVLHFSGRALSDVEQAALERHLAAKHGIVAITAESSGDLAAVSLPVSVGLPFPPSPLPPHTAPMYWFDASDLVSTTADSASVCSLGSKGFLSAVNLTQLTASRCPTFAAPTSDPNSPGGRAGSLVFNSDQSQHLLLSPIDFYASPSTFMYVARHVSLSALSQNLGFFVSGSEPSWHMPPQLDASVNLAGSMGALYFPASSWSNPKPGSSPYLALDGERHVWTVIVRSPALAEIYMDGALLMSAAVDTSTRMTNMFVGGRWIGTGTGAYCQCMTSHLHELMIFDRALGQDERAAAERGLAAKHGVAKGAYEPLSNYSSATRVAYALVASSSAASAAATATTPAAGLASVAVTVASPSNALLWLDAASLAAGGAQDGAAVASWSHKGTYAAVAAATSPSAQRAPIFWSGDEAAAASASAGSTAAVVVGSLVSAPFVRFNSSSATQLSVVFPAVAVTVPYTLMYVLRARAPAPTSGGESRFVTSPCTGAQGSLDWQAPPTCFGKTCQAGYARTGTAAKLFDSEFITVPSTHFAVYTLVQRSSAVTQLYINGEHQGVSVASPLAPGNGITLGGRHSPSCDGTGGIFPNSASGDLGQFALWNRVLSGMERRAAETRMAAAYNVSRGLFAPRPPASLFHARSVAASSAAAFAAPASALVWLDAAAIRGHNASEASLAAALCSWQNMGSLGGTAAQATSTRCPTYAPSPWPGATAGAVRFSSQRQTFLTLGFGASGEVDFPYTLSFVGRYNGSASAAGHLVSSSQSPLWSVGYAPEAATGAQNMGVGRQGSSTAMGGAAIPADALPHIFTLVARDEMISKMYVDGTLLWDDHSGTAIRAAPAGGLALGGDISAASPAFFSGELAELVLVADEMDETSRARLEAFFARKHGVRTGQFGGDSLFQINGGCVSILPNNETGPLSTEAGRWRASRCSAALSARLAITHACCEMPSYARVATANTPPTWANSSLAAIMASAGRLPLSVSAAVGSFFVNVAALDADLPNTKASRLTYTFTALPPPTAPACVHPLNVTAYFQIDPVGGNVTVKASLATLLKAFIDLRGAPPALTAGMSSSADVSFNVTATDGGLASATYEILIALSNSAPTFNASASQAAVQVRTALISNVEEIGAFVAAIPASDPDGPATDAGRITYQLFSESQLALVDGLPHASYFAISSAGTVTVNASLAKWPVVPSGLALLTVRATDGLGAFSIATLRVTITRARMANRTFFSPGALLPSASCWGGSAVLGDRTYYVPLFTALDSVTAYVRIHKVVLTMALRGPDGRVLTGSSAVGTRAAGSFVADLSVAPMVDGPPPTALPSSAASSRFPTAEPALVHRTLYASAVSFNRTSFVNGLMTATVSLGTGGGWGGGALLPWASNFTSSPTSSFYGAGLWLGIRVRTDLSDPSVGFALASCRGGLGPSRGEPRAYVVPAAGPDGPSTVSLPGCLALAIIGDEAVPEDMPLPRSLLPSGPCGTSEAVERAGADVDPLEGAGAFGLAWRPSAAPSASSADYPLWSSPLCAVGPVPPCPAPKTRRVGLASLSVLVRNASATLSAAGASGAGIRAALLRMPGGGARAIPSPPLSEPAASSYFGALAAYPGYVAASQIAVIDATQLPPASSAAAAGGEAWLTFSFSNEGSDSPAGSAIMSMGIPVIEAYALLFSVPLDLVPVRALTPAASSPAFTLPAAVALARGHTSGSEAGVLGEAILSQSGLPLTPVFRAQLTYSSPPAFEAPSMNTSLSASCGVVDQLVMGTPGSESVPVVTTIGFTFSPLDVGTGASACSDAVGGEGDAVAVASVSVFLSSSDPVVASGAAAEVLPRMDLVVNGLRLGDPTFNVSRLDDVIRVGRSSRTNLGGEGGSPGAPALSPASAQWSEALGGMWATWSFEGTAAALTGVPRDASVAAVFSSPVRAPSRSFASSASQLSALTPGSAGYPSGSLLTYDPSTSTYSLSPEGSDLVFRVVLSRPMWHCPQRECMPGMYEAVACGVGVERVCLPCNTTCTASVAANATAATQIPQIRLYRARACTAAHNEMCLPCSTSQCPEGFWESAGCGDEADRVCSPCLRCAAGYFAASACAARGNDTVCSPCPAGQFSSSENTDAACEGTCPAGFACPGATATPVPCGSAAVYCPAGSASPIIVPDGYLSGPLDSEPQQRSEVLSCPAGKVCSGGLAVEEGLVWAEPFAAQACAPDQFSPPSAYVASAPAFGAPIFSIPLVIAKPTLGGTGLSVSVKKVTPIAGSAKVPLNAFAVSTGGEAQPASWNSSVLAVIVSLSVGESGSPSLIYAGSSSAYDVTIAATWGHPSEAAAGGTSGGSYGGALAPGAAFSPDCVLRIGVRSPGFVGIVCPEGSILQNGTDTCFASVARGVA